MIIHHILKFSNNFSTMSDISIDCDDDCCSFDDDCCNCGDDCALDCACCAFDSCIDICAWVTNPYTFVIVIS